MQFKKHLFWLIPLLILDAVGLVIYFRHSGAERHVEAEVGPNESPAAPRSGPFNTMVFPTGKPWPPAAPAEEVFQPTASGRLESALYGSTRTRRLGDRLLPAFHEGVDIAAQSSDRRGRALDEIMAVADGTVGYINSISGKSNYGKYIVLMHADPLGEVYTLYAHLSDIADELRVGQPVSAGQTIGIMGNTPAANIPRVRSHLHFEIGVILNNRFRSWQRHRKLKPDHGRFHGWNLLGINPQAVFSTWSKNPGRFTLADYFTSITPPAFEVVLRADELPDYFRRYPLLWMGAPFQGSAMVVACSENGVPLSGHKAEPDELAALAGRADLVRNVDVEVLGRNGARLIIRKNGKWVLGKNGVKWREMLLFN